MLHNWEAKGLDNAQLLFIHAEKKDVGRMNSFPNVLRGRIQYIGTIRGKKDELFQKLAVRFTNLYEQEFNKKHFWKLTDNEEFKHYKAKSVSVVTVNFITSSVSLNIEVNCSFER